MIKFGKMVLLVMVFMLLFISFSIVTSYAADYIVTYNSSDATANINSAIQSAVNNPGVDRVILAYQGNDTKWISGPIQLYDDMEFVLEEGVVLEAKSGAFSTYAPFILVSGRTNVKVTGNNATVRMLIDEYTDGEWRHCISVRSSSDITIQGLTLQKSGGDGIYLGSNGTPNSNVVIDDVICDGNARNGISVISVVNLTISNTDCINTGIYNSSGLSASGPWAGIDVEPNDSSEVLSNIEITNCNLNNNLKYGIEFNLSNFGPTSEEVLIEVNGCTVKNSDYGIVAFVAAEGTTGEISVENSTVENTQNCALKIKDWAYDGVLFSINNCSIINPKRNSSGSGAIEIEASESATYSTGNISINNTYITKNKSPYPLRLVGGNSSFNITNVSGSIYTDQMDAGIGYNLYYNNINVAINNITVGFSNAFCSDLDGAGGTDSEPFFTSSNAKLYKGDYNGDGKTDFFVKGYSTTRALYVANSTGTGFSRKFYGTADGTGGTDSEAFFTSSSAIIYTGDYNGDGRTDLFVKGYGTWRALYLANSTGNGFVCAFQGDADDVGGTDSEAFLTDSNAIIYPGDYNGDGKTDLFVKGYGTWRALYLANSTGDGFVCAFQGDADDVGGTDSEAFLTDSSAIVYPGDYNGDGKTDLFVKNYGTWRALYLANSGGDGFSCAFQGEADSVGGTDSEAFFTDASAKVYAGDYNGDGKTDLFVKGYGTWRALYLANSNGNGFSRQFYGTTDGIGGTDSEAFFTNSSGDIYTGDYNGDGKTDLFVKGYGTWRALYIASSLGNSFVCAFQGDADSVGGTDSEEFFTDASANIYTGDYNGDGKTDLFIKGYSTWRALYISGISY